MTISTTRERHKLADKHIWTGVSGKTYAYFIYPNLPNFKANQDGNYIFAKFVDNAWTPIYIGEGCLSDRCSDQHHQADCVESKGATHVHVHLNAVEDDRTAEEKDLLAAFPQAYVPTGCNVKIGG